MNKHPTPWTIDQSGGYIVDAIEVDVARVDTPDPEARAGLLHAGEMWEELNELLGTRPTTRRCVDLVNKINAEIAKGKP